jgi:G3E family GTPase
MVEIASHMVTPIHIISGFLGTGKTTALLDQLSRRAGHERVAVIVNDFGEAGMDAARAAEGGARIQEIPGGCICCTAPEGFPAAVATLLDEVKPDRIFVEPTGLARPADLVDTLRRGPDAHRLVVAPLIVLVDPANMPPLPVFTAQVEAADVLVANRCDLADEPSMLRFRSMAAALWPAPQMILETSHGVVPDSAFVGMAQDSTAHHHHHDSTEGFGVQTWTWGLDPVFSRMRLVELLARLAPQVTRLKGIFRTDDGVWRLEIAGGQVHEARSDHRRGSRLDLILPSACKLPQGLLEPALLTAEERVVDPEQVEVVRPDGSRLVLDRRAIRALDGVPDIAPFVEGRTGPAAHLAALLEAAGVGPLGEAIAVASDGFATDPVPLTLLKTGYLLHSTADGEPLGKGGPFRLFVPDADNACANVKGVVRLVIREAHP